MVTGSRSWKAYLENPWDSPLCPSTSIAYAGYNGSVKPRGLDGEIYARGHTLVVPTSTTGQDDFPVTVTTVVSGGMTLYVDVERIQLSGRHLIIDSPALLRRSMLLSAM